MTVTTSAALAAGAVLSDDIANRSGLGAPAILNGTVYAHRAARVTLGAGQSTSVRQATLAGLQAAVNYAVSTGKFFELVPGTYEIDGAAGLVIPAASGFVWRGSKLSQIVQYASNAPILTIGDATGANQSYQNRIEGFGLNYGASQTGQVNANALVLCSAGWCVVSDLTICTQQSGYLPVNPPNIALNIPASTAGATFFNNAVRDVQIGGAQTNLFCLGMQGSGNKFDNIYMKNGNNISGNQAYQGVLSGPALLIGNSAYATMSDNSFSRINIEACKTSGNLVLLQEAFNTTFDAVHLEGTTLTGYGANFVYIVGGQVVVNGIMFSECATTADACSFVKSSGAAEVSEIHMLDLIWSYVSGALKTGATPLIAVDANADWSPQMRVTGIRSNDSTPGGTNAANLVLDSISGASLKSVGYGATVGEYVGDGFLPQTSRYTPVVTANYTHYGLHADASADRAVGTGRPGRPHAVKPLQAVRFRLRTGDAVGHQIARAPPIGQLRQYPDRG